MKDVTIWRDSVQIRLGVETSIDTAFRLFSQGFSRWYPREYSWSGEVLEWIGMEPHVGGRCFEVGPYGFHSDWGRVLAWEPPHRLAFTWQIGANRQPVPNPELAGEVDVQFVELEAATTLTLFHRGFNHFQGNPDEYLRQMASDDGWPHMLGRLRDFCHNQGDFGSQDDVPVSAP